MTNFRVGQKVVLVDDSPINFKGCAARADGRKAGVQYPTVGSVYTVRKAYVASNGMVGILLAEIDNHAACLRLGLSDEIGFPAIRFRPVVERKTDISIFKAMLNPSRVKEHA